MSSKYLHETAQLIQAAQLAIKYPTAYSALRKTKSKRPRIVLLSTYRWKKPKELGWSIVHSDMVSYEFGVRGLLGKISLSWGTVDYYASHAPYHLENILKMDKYTKIYKAYKLKELKTLAGEDS